MTETAPAPADATHTPLPVAPASPPASGLYRGHVVHRRFRPRAHRLRYSVFWLLLDLDEIDDLDRQLTRFSRNRFNLFSFFDRDYGDRSGRALRGQIMAHLATAGIDTVGRIRVLTMPRILGYVFNPLSVFFCHAPDGTLAVILYEVSNTFGERHSYLIPVADPLARPIRQSVDKCFFVSPFLDMALTYDFVVEPPDAGVMISIAVSKSDGPMLTAALAGERVELTDAALTQAFWGSPLLTLKVIAGIHWEALLMVLKRIGLHRKPVPPAHPVSLGSGHPSGR